MRHKEPEFLTQWKEWYQAGPPRCCHTCENYGVDGLCVTFFMKPPEDFAAAQNSCEQWEQEIPL